MSSRLQDNLILEREAPKLSRVKTLFQAFQHEFECFFDSMNDKVAFKISRKGFTPRTHRVSVSATSVTHIVMCSEERNVERVAVQRPGHEPRRRSRACYALSRFPVFSEENGPLAGCGRIRGALP